MQDEVIKYIGCTKALLTWFHAAHHVTKGPGFAGDHVNLYGEIYNNIVEDFDALVEKIIVVCAIAAVGFQFMRHHVDHLTKLHQHLESKRLLTLGTGDYLAAAANQYETYIYLLGQRVKRGDV